MFHGRRRPDLGQRRGEARPAGRLRVAKEPRRRARDRADHRRSRQHPADWHARRTGRPRGRAVACRIERVRGEARRLRCARVEQASWRGSAPRLRSRCASRRSRASAGAAPGRLRRQRLRDQVHRRRAAGEWQSPEGHPSRGTTAPNAPDDQRLSSPGDRLPSSGNRPIAAEMAPADGAPRHANETPQPAIAADPATDAAGPALAQRALRRRRACRPNHQDPQKRG